MPERFFQHGRLGGFGIITFSAALQWLADHGLSDSMTLIAIAGLLIQVFTSLPAIERSLQTIKSWRRRKSR